MVPRTYLRVGRRNEPRRLAATTPTVRIATRVANRRQRRMACGTGSPGVSPAASPPR
jgi:hypothetical protein